MPSWRRSVVMAVVVAALAVGGCGGPLPSASPVVTASPALLTRDQAVAAARLASDLYADGDVLQAEMGPYSKYTNEVTAKASPIPDPDSMVWWISLGTNPGPLMGQGEFFVVDAADGHVVEHYGWIS